MSNTISSDPVTQYMNTLNSSMFAHAQVFSLGQHSVVFVILHLYIYYARCRASLTSVVNTWWLGSGVGVRYLITHHLVLLLGDIRIRVTQVAGSCFVQTRTSYYRIFM